jgi:hypothetical protein
MVSKGIPSLDGQGQESNNGDQANQDEDACQDVLEPLEALSPLSPDNPPFYGNAVESDSDVQFHHGQ